MGRSKFGGSSFNRFWLSDKILKFDKPRNVSDSTCCNAKRPRSKSCRLPKGANIFSGKNDNDCQKATTAASPGRSEGILRNACDVLPVQTHIFEAKNAYKTAACKVLCPVVILDTAARKTSEIRPVNRVEARRKQKSNDRDQQTGRIPEQWLQGKTKNSSLSISEPYLYML